MDNTMKLLLALCDALGFKVERKVRIYGMDCTEFMQMKPVDQCKLRESYNFQDNEQVDYKLTKKDMSRATLD